MNMSLSAVVPMASGRRWSTEAWLINCDREYYYYSRGIVRWVTPDTRPGCQPWCLSFGQSIFYRVLLRLFDEMRPSAGTYRCRCGEFSGRKLRRRKYSRLLARRDYNSCCCCCRHRPSPFHKASDGPNQAAWIFADKSIHNRKQSVWAATSLRLWLCYSLTYKYVQGLIEQVVNASVLCTHDGSSTKVHYWPCSRCDVWLLICTEWFPVLSGCVFNFSVFCFLSFRCIFVLFIYFVYFMCDFQ